MQQVYAREQYGWSSGEAEPLDPRAQGLVQKRASLGVPAASEDQSPAVSKKTKALSLDCADMQKLRQDHANRWRPSTNLQPATTGACSFGPSTGTDPFLLWGAKHAQRNGNSSKQNNKTTPKSRFNLSTSNASDSARVSP